jgi:hypothetical protein
MSHHRRRQNLARAAARETTNLRANLAPPALVRPHFPGVDTSEWTDLPPAQYPPDTVAFIRRTLELGDLRLARVKGYRCDACNLVLATLDRHLGFSPDYLDHARILDSRCPGTFISFGYPEEDLPAGAAPAFEWFRPGEVALLELGDEFINHVMKGGLILRPNPEAANIGQALR